MSKDIKILIVALFFPVLVEAQINDSLKIICELIEVKNDSTCFNCDAFIKSRNYDIQLFEDTLIIKINSVDSLKWSNDPQDRHVSIDVYKLNINDIKHINYISSKKQLYDLNWVESYIEFSTLREYPLFKHKYKGSIQKTDMIKLHLVNQNDTINFKKLYNFFVEHLDLESNYIPPSCNVENITLNTIVPQKINLIEQNNLEEPIRLNGTDNLDQELQRILMDYLVQENLMKLYGDIIINQNNEMIHFESYQNEMHNYLNTLDSIPASFSVLKETGFLKLTDKHKLQIENLLKDQDWKTGKCNKQLVNSYFDFYVENKDYKKPGDNNK